MKQIENDQKGNIRFQFSGKMISPLSENAIANTNGKNYKLTNIEFTDAQGNLRQAGAAIYEGNYSHGVKQGETYLCTATIVGKVVHIQMSHLNASAGRVEVDAFLGAVETAAPVTVDVTTGEVVS